MPEWASISTAAAALGCSDSYVRRLIRQQKLYTMGRGYNRVVWLGNGSPIKPAPDELEAEADSLDELLGPLIGRLIELSKELDWPHLTEALRAEIEGKGTDLLLALRKAKEAQQVKRFHL